MKIAEFLKKENIFEFSLVPYNSLRVVDPHREEKMIFRPLSAVVFLMPYYVDEDKTNLSRYARSRDYHYYVKELISRAEEKLDTEFCCFADTSPIDEVGAALVSGLGCAGKNGLIINPRYGSFVFIGEFFFPFDTTHEFFEGVPIKKPLSHCTMCGACRSACPTGGINDKSRCVSFINQKKKLDENDVITIEKSGMVWGCDICQEVCPMNKREETPIHFFMENRITSLNSDIFDELLESGEFLRRAFAWRGAQVVKRNVDILEKYRG